MDFSVDQAKSIFDLIKIVSPYAYPLLISLVFPIFWILLKRLLGLSNTTNTNPPQGNFLRRFFVEVGRVISLNGDTADRIVFYTCVILFFAGGVILKVGEYNEEVLRQRTLGLKHLYDESGYLFYDTSALRKIGYTKAELDDITYEYPDEFLWSGKKIVCVDSTVKRNVYAINHVLLDAYLRERLKHDSVVYLDSLFQEDVVTDTTSKKEVELRNVKNFFSVDIVYTYLAKTAYKDKYNLDVKDDKTIIITNR